MWRARLGIASVAALLLLPGLARAGALSDVSHGMRDQSDNDDSSSSGSSGGSSNSGSSGNDSSSSSDWSSSSSSGSGSCCGHSSPNLGINYGWVPPGPGQVDSLIYVGAQAVEDSDGAFTVEARASYEDFALGARATSYYERRPGVKDAQYIHVDMWWLGGAWRLAHDADFSAWLEAGLAGVDNDGVMSLTGGALGFVLEKDLPGQLGARAAVRRFWFEDDINANEAFAAVTLSLLQVSYRVMDFNVGPALHGPEVGLILFF